MADEKRLEQNLCWEVGIVQQMKHGEKICGDSVSVTKQDDRMRIVLSDGLGSGIQANIASTLTAKLISGLTERGLTVEDGIRAVEAVLPTTKKHNLAYATFTLVTTEGRTVRLVQYDNPPAVFLRDGVSLEYPTEQAEFGEKTVLESVLTMKNGDMLVLFSDGVSEAGRGVTTYSGWDRREMEDYLLRSVGPDDHARSVAAQIVSAAQALDLFEYHDDTTVVVLRLRERQIVILRFRPEGGLTAEREAGTEGCACLTVEEETVQDTLNLLERYLQDGMMSLRMEETQDEATGLLELLAEEASDVNILICRSEESPENTRKAPARCETAERIRKLRQLLTEAGKRVTVRIC